MPMKFPPASQAYTGMKLPPSQFPLMSQTVKWQDVDPEDPEFRIVHTDQGSWRFRWDQMMVFPRRPDGSTKDWRNEKIFPTVRDVVVGDIFACVDPKPDVNDEKMMKVWNARYQQVTRMYHAARYEFVRVQTFESAMYTTRTWNFHVTELIVFPRVETSLESNKRETIDRSKRYGPYVDKQVGNTYMFLVHPTGRGRWPGNLAPFRFVQQEADDVIVSRPPTCMKGGWDQFILLSEGEPHPNDPYKYASLDDRLALIKHRDQIREQIRDSKIHTR
jgi:hypothetical protein